jgi:hypothetical protein
VAAKSPIFPLRRGDQVAPSLADGGAAGEPEPPGLLFGVHRDDRDLGLDSALASTPRRASSAAAKPARPSKHISSNPRVIYPPLCGATITKTPATAMVAPRRSHRSGRNPSTTIPHSRASAMKIPP